MTKKLKSSFDWDHSNLYLGHFYVQSNENSSDYELYIVMNKCEIILHDLIKKVHNLEDGKEFDQSFKPVKKFPVSVLLSICDLFFEGNGSSHNDLKPQNIGFMINYGKVGPEYIDLGSAGRRGTLHIGVF